MIKYTIYPGEHWFYYEFLDRPKLPAQFRFNWSSPLVLSPNNPHTIYFAGNYLFKSVDRGEQWRIISDDLTTNDPALRNPSKSGYLTNSVTGGENHFTIVTVAESPLNEALVWVGTDDGFVHVTKDAGASWTEVGVNIPDLDHRIWVSRVEPSRHVEGRCYVTLDNHRYDDMKPYVFVTEDFGKTWQNITNNLPKDFSAYVIREDPVNSNLLFVGTEEAVHFSYDRGGTWQELMANMPTVAIHDLIIHPRDGDLIAGTHGRSIWILDDISALRQLDKTVLYRPIHLFDSRVATKWHYSFTGRTQPHFEFRGQNPAYGAPIQFYLQSDPRDSVIITVEAPFTDHQVSWKVAGKQGINRKYWNFTFPRTTKEQEALRKHLEQIIAKLEMQVEQSTLREKLELLSEELKDANTPDALKEVRKQLTEYFAGYAAGKPFFGKKMQAVEAEPGRYRVRVEAGNIRAEGWLYIREDPLQKN